MIEPGGWTATLLLDGRVLAAGGGSAGLSAELYDPISGTWTATGAMIEGGQTATRLLDGRVLVTGGGSVGSSAELYDPDSGTWTATGSMIEDQLGHTATLLTDGRVLVAGGYREDVSGYFANILDSAELYDPVSGTWTLTGNMIQIRVGHFATLLTDGRVLVAGGGSVSDGDGGPLASAELYDPDTGSWTATGSMIEASSRTSVLLADGRVLAAGGGLGDGSPAELYDPDTGSWTATGNMAEGRFGPSATLLLDGRVLVAGGNSNGGLLASAELYDPTSGSWAGAGAMEGVRACAPAILLLNGKVLVVGGCSKDGSNDDSGLLASAELYDPGSGT
jgi:N-acetylneuraminic acid mutarotase